MEGRPDLSYFKLDGVDKRLGYEKARKLSNDGVWKITLAIPPHATLRIASTIEFQLFVPSKYHIEGDILVTTHDLKVQKYLSESNIRQQDDHYELLLPGMNKVKYPFPVWLYYIRSLLEAPRATEWTVATPLENEFKHVSADWPAVPSSPARELRFFIGAGRTRGKRNYMEDVDFAFEDINISSRRSISVVGVMDGHGGKECAQFCADEVPMRIAALLRNGSSCPDAMYRAFREVDVECLESNACGCSGSTANVAMYDRATNVFYFANTGDTRAVLSRSGQARDLSYDRKGTDPEEMARVARAGGYVAKGRIMGTLAVSRALGDLQLKEQGALRLQRVLIPDPELSCFYPTRSDDFIIIATDGLWDVMSSQAAVDFARGLLVQEGLLDNDLVESLGAETIKTRLSQIAHNMAVHAVSGLHSMDNVTVLIVLLRGGPTSCPIDLSASVEGAHSSAGYEDSALDDARASDTGALGWAGDLRNSRQDVGDVRSSATQLPKSIPGNEERIEQDWSGPTVVFRHGNALLGDTSSPTNTAYMTSATNYTSTSSTNDSPYYNNAGAAKKPAPLGKPRSAAEDSDDDDLMDFLKDDSNF